VGVQARQEAYQVDCIVHRLAPQQHLARCGNCGRQGLCLLGIHQGYRSEVSQLMYPNIPKLTVRPEPNVWGDRLPFGTICGDFGTPNGGWVHDVAFSPSGDSLAYVSE